jgi:predicted regulator of Ras-like GTPase activity (Roadblock/LC7/MglB family)
LKQKTTIEVSNELDDSIASISAGDDPVFEKLAASLIEICQTKGIHGYILRNGTSAIVNLNEQDKIVEYALFCSQISESGSEMAQQFSLANIESVLIEGKTVKVLCMSIDENKVDIFMEKTASHTGLIKKILA